jgi:hypothetical protein
MDLCYDPPYPAPASSSSAFSASAPSPPDTCDLDLCAPDPPPPISSNATTVAISHKVTFANLANAAAYVGDTKIVYEAGYAEGIGIYNLQTKSLKTGCTLTSSAVRRAASVTFQAQVAAAISAAAKAKGIALSPAALSAAIATVNQALGKNVTVPTQAQLTVVDLTSGSADSSEDLINKGWFIAILAIVCAVALIALAIFAYHFCGPHTQQPEEPDAKQPGVEMTIHADSTTTKEIEHAPGICAPPAAGAAGAAGPQGRMCC